MMRELRTETEEKEIKHPSDLRNETEDILRRLLNNTYNSDDYKDAEKDLFANIESYEQCVPDLSKYCGTPKIPDDVNKKNIQEVLKLIYEERFNDREEWENENIYDETFLKILHTPIYIPSIFPDLISGEYLVYLVHKNVNHYEIMPREKTKALQKAGGDDPEKSAKIINRMIYERKYQRIYGSNTANRENSILGRIEKALSIRINIDTSEVKRSSSASWIISDMLSYLCYFDEKTTAKYSKEDFNNFSGKKPLNVLDKKTLELFNIFQINDIEDEKIKLMIYKTLLFQKLDDNRKLDLYNRTIAIQSYILRGIIILDKIKPQLMTTKCIYKLLRKNDAKGNELLLRYFEECKQALDELCQIAQTGNCHEQSRVSYLEYRDDNQLYYLILHRILLKEAITYAKTNFEYRYVFEKNSAESAEYTIYHSIKPDTYIGTDTPTTFFNTYPAITKQLLANSGSEKEKEILNRDWHLCVRLFSYIYPNRFNLTKDEVHNMESTLNIQWLREHSVGKVLDLKEFFLMLLVIRDIKEKENIFYKKLRRKGTNVTEVDLAKVTQLYESKKMRMAEYFIQGDIDSYQLICRLLFKGIQCIYYPVKELRQEDTGWANLAMWISLIEQNLDFLMENIKRHNK